MASDEFNVLLVDNAGFLKPFAVNLTKDKDKADDLYQETIYKALANKEKYNSGTNIKAWLYTIMRNIFINNYRRNSKYRIQLTGSLAEVTTNVKNGMVQNEAVANIRIKQIAEAIHGLPEIFKTPFQLYIDGYRYQEIATVLAEPLGTIKSRIHFARKLLKEKLQRM